MTSPPHGGWLDCLPIALLLLAVPSIICCGPAPRSQPLAVEVAGCLSIHGSSIADGPSCQLTEDRRLQLWIPLPLTVEVTVGPGAHIVERLPVQDGQRWLLDIAPNTRRLEVEANLATENGPRRATWSLALEHRPQAPWRAELQRLQERGEQASAEAWLRSRLAAGSPPEDRGDQLFRLAGLIYRRGDSAAARRVLAEAMAWYRDNHRPLDWLRSGTALSFWLHGDDLWAEEREVLDALQATGSSTAEGDFLLHFFHGQLALESGDLRTAQRRLTDAVQQAERVGLTSFRHQSEQLLARALTRGGRPREAEAIFERLADDPAGLADGCQGALFLNNLGWSRLLQLEAGRQANPLPPLERALDLLQGCPDGEGERVNVLTNLALAALHQQDNDRSRSFLQRARRLQPRPQRRILLWWQEIEARLALAAGDHGVALSLFSQEARSAAEASIPRAQWRAELGTARTLWALGEQTQALEAFQRSAELLDSEALNVPVGEDRAAFVAQREWASCLHLEALLAAGRPAAAMQAARRSRSRVLRSLWRGQRLAFLTPPDRQRWDANIARYHAMRSALDRNLQDEWQLPKDQLAGLEARRRSLQSNLQDTLDTALEVLASPGGATHRLPPRIDGELLLVYHPGDGGWLGFAEGQDGVVVASLGNVSPATPGDRLAAILLAPFADLVRRSSAVRVLPYGELRDIDFHALPFDGAPLIVQRPVVYGLDLPSGPNPIEPVATALMVIDPNQDLPSTRQEKKVLHGALERQSVQRVHWLEGSTADGTAVRQLLPEVDLFHFAGHGVFDGWDSALGLAKDSRLSVGDIFALPQVPERVILSGCETGRSGDLDLYRLEDAAGIGAAFLTAGSREVIATQRPVDDRLAADLMSGLYPLWAAGGSAAEALRQAQIAQWRRYPASDWASFRALSP